MNQLLTPPRETTPAPLDLYAPIARDLEEVESVLERLFIAWFPASPSCCTTSATTAANVCAELWCY